MRILIIVIMLFATITASAQSTSSLYYRRSQVIHTWDDYMVVDKDTAFYYLLSEIHFAVNWSSPDTLIKQQDGTYIGKYGKLCMQGNELYWLRKRKEKYKKPILLKPADEKMRLEWTKRHLQLMEPIDDPISNNDSIRRDIMNALYRSHQHLGLPSNY